MGWAVPGGWATWIDPGRSVREARAGAQRAQVEPSPSYHPTVTAPDVLAFADRRTDGSYAVTEPSGTTVARIEVSAWSGQKFQAFAADGEPLCSGRKRNLLSSWWDAVDPGGRPLASLRNSLTGTRKEVRLPDERVLTVRGQWFGRDWSMRDDSGRDVLTSEPTTSSWSFRPDAWVVRSHDASLDLAQVVGIVELNRLMVKAGRSSSS